MGSGDLRNDQKDVVWRYAHCAGLWRRKQGRNFASLESDMRAGYEIVAAGIAIEARQGHPVILTDAKDPAVFAAIFKKTTARFLRCEHSTWSVHAGSSSAARASSPCTHRC